MMDIGVYVHIPFCKSKCYYCDFVSYENKNELIEGYINALKKEIENACLEKYRVKTVYIGGGTPSVLNSDCIRKILEAIKLDNDAEITIEVNPGTICEKKLRDYINFGINRISIGVQVTDNAMLKQIGRIHTFEEFLEGYNLLRKVGFKNINVDLMLGLPGQTLNMLKKSVSEVIDLNPEHISIYSFILEEGTKLEKLINAGKLKIMDEDLERHMYWESKRILEENGYIHYEISNFAKPGFMSKHNLDCWNQKEYIGFGVASHSYINKMRYSNLEEIEEYINNIKNSDFGKNILVHEKQKSKDARKRVYAIGIEKN